MLVPATIRRKAQASSGESAVVLSRSHGDVRRKRFKSALLITVYILALGGVGCGLFVLMTRKGGLDDPRGLDFHSNMGGSKGEQEVKVTKVQRSSKEKHWGVSHFLDMLRGNKEATAEDGWKVCKRYKERDLPPHKKVSSRV